MNIDYTIGDDIVSITYATDGRFKENEVFKALDIIKGCIHFPILVDIGLKVGVKSCGCCYCGTLHSHTIQYAIAHNFKKLDTLVNISELMEVLEQPAFS